MYYDGGNWGWFPEPPDEPRSPSPCEEYEYYFLAEKGPSLMVRCLECGKWHNTYYAALMDVHYADVLPQAPYIYGWLPF